MSRTAGCIRTAADVWGRSDNVIMNKYTYMNVTAFSREHWETLHDLWKNHVDDEK